jgi:hypothetical protein
VSRQVRYCQVTGLPVTSCECYEYLGIGAAPERASELPDGKDAFIDAMVARYELRWSDERQRWEE